MEKQQRNALEQASRNFYGNPNQNSLVLKHSNVLFDGLKVFEESKVGTYYVIINQRAYPIEFNGDKDKTRMNAFHSERERVGIVLADTRLALGEPIKDFEVSK